MTTFGNRIRAAALAVVALLVSAACGLGAGSSSSGTVKAEVGVTSNQVIIGTTTPLSGPASFYAPLSRASNAYYAYVNSHGGVNGRQIKYIVLDDGYDPAKSVPLTHQLVEQENVYAVVGQLGTPVNTATRPYLNDQKVPDVFVLTGATKWGAEYKTFPWTIGLQPDYQSEAKVYAKDIIKSHANAKIGVLYQNDDFGKDYLNGLTAGLGSNSGWIVGSASYEPGAPDVSSQVAALKDKGADLLLIAAIPTQGISAMKTLAKLNWKPTVYISNVLTSTTNTKAVIAAGGGANIDGMTSTFYGKDPNDPKWASDPTITAYKNLLSSNCSTGTPQQCDPADATYFTGLAGAWLFVKILKSLGKDGVTRDNLMHAVRNMNITACADPITVSADKIFDSTCDPFLFPGLTIKTSGDNQWPITQLAPAKFSTSAGRWIIDYANIISAR